MRFIFRFRSLVLIPAVVAFCVLFLFLFFEFTSKRHAKSDRIIVHFQPGLSSRRDQIIAHKTYIDSLPFDGITINSPQTSELLAPGYVGDYYDLYNNWLLPIRGQLVKVTHNYFLLDVRPSADPFDDWTQTIANWVILSRATHDAGLEGIFFDNETYYGQMWNYPGECKYGLRNSLSQYQEQYRLRGQQVMEAIRAAWPAVRIIHAHSPCESESRTPASITIGQCIGTDTDLAGYFFAGMLSVSPDHVIDGGELYQYRTPTDFFNSYRWRKTLQPNLSPNTLIPSSLAKIWPSYSNISFGMYDQQWVTGYPVDPTIWQTTITNALRQTDYIAWTYAQNHDYLTPGGVSKDWIDAIWNARTAAGMPAPGSKK